MYYGPYSDREKQTLEEVADSLAAVRRQMEISDVSGLDDPSASLTPIGDTSLALRRVLILLDRENYEALYARITTNGWTVRQAQRDIESDN